MPTYSQADLDKGALNVYNNAISIYGLAGARKVIKQVRILLKAERARRLKLKPSERCLEDDEEKQRLKSKSSTKVKKKKKKGIGMFASLCILFDKVGVSKVTYAEAKACAKEAKPDSNLSSGHFKWYKKLFKEQRKK